MLSNGTPSLSKSSETECLDSVLPRPSFQCFLSFCSLASAPFLSFWFTGIFCPSHRLSLRRSSSWSCYPSLKACSAGCCVSLYSRASLAPDLEGCAPVGHSGWDDMKLCLPYSPTGALSPALCTSQPTTQACMDSKQTKGRTGIFCERTPVSRFVFADWRSCETGTNHLLLCFSFFK